MTCGPSKKRTGLDRKYCVTRIYNTQCLSNEEDVTSKLIWVTRYTIPANYRTYSRGDLYGPHYFNPDEIQHGITGQSPRFCISDIYSRCRQPLFNSGRILFHLFSSILPSSIIIQEIERIKTSVLYFPWILWQFNPTNMYKV